MVIVKFFLIGDDTGKLHTREFESYKEHEEFMEGMAGSMEVFSEKTICKCEFCESFRLEHM